MDHTQLHAYLLAADLEPGSGRGGSVRATPLTPDTRASLLSRAAARLCAADDCPRIGWVRSMELSDAAHLLRRAGEPDRADRAMRMSWSLSSSASIGISALWDEVIALEARESDQ